MQEVNASIITIGDELLIGQTIDTNSAFISQELNKIGIWVKRRISIGDVKEEIINTLKEESEKATVIIVTGGLGPTADDITKPSLCEFFNTHLVMNEDALENVRTIFTKLGRTVSSLNIKQAEVPANCTVLKNERGTAPGMWFEKTEGERNAIYISLPGVPHEMKGLMHTAVIPKLKGQLDLPAVQHKSLLTAGKGESEIAELLVHFESSLPQHIKLAYLPDYGMVKLRLTARGTDKDQLQSELNQFFSILKDTVSYWLVSDEDVSIVNAVSKNLKDEGKTLATAESCTGGYIAHLITSIAGSSAFYSGSVICYSNDVKQAILGVNEAVLKHHGAVSEETVSQMAIGVREKLNTDFAIATSGIMGPAGGTSDKPVGTVWIAIAGEKGVKSQKFFFRFDRNRNIQLAAHAALNLLRKFMIESK